MESNLDEVSTKLGHMIRSILFLSIKVHNVEVFEIHIVKNTLNLSRNPIVHYRGYCGQDCCIHLNFSATEL